MQLYFRSCDLLFIPRRQRLPPTALGLLRFATVAFGIYKKSHGVISAALTAIRSFCGAIGHDTTKLLNPQLSLFMKHVRKSSPSKKRRRLPITIWSLASLRKFVGKRHIDHVMFGAMVVGLFALLRASEYVDKAPYGCSLLRKHISFSSDGQRATIHLVRSKTDVFSEGVDVVVYANGSNLCPVSWLRAVMSLAPRKAPDTPVFQNSLGSPLSYASYQRFIARLCKRANLTGGKAFSTHSLRIGGATSLIALGFDTAVVKLLGRWKSEAFQVYVRIDEAIHRRVSMQFAAAAGDSTSSITCGLPLLEFSSLHSDGIDSFGDRFARCGQSLRQRG
jgi:hypothetical protein